MAEASYMSVIIADLFFASVLETLRTPSVCPEKLRSPRTAGQKPMKPQPLSPRNSELRGRSSHAEVFKCDQTDPGDDRILPRVWQALNCPVGSPAPSPAPLCTSQMCCCPGNRPMPQRPGTGCCARVPAVSLEAVMTAERLPLAGT